MVGNYTYESWISVKWWEIILYNHPIIYCQKVGFLSNGEKLYLRSWISVKWWEIIRMKAGFLSNGGHQKVEFLSMVSSYAVQFCNHFFVNVRNLC